MAKTTVSKLSGVWDGFDRAGAQRQHRMIWMGSGEVGSGKTRFGLTAPGPILIQSLDKGLEGVVEPILEEFPDKEIYFKEYEWNPTDDFDQDKAVEIREEIKKDFLHGLKYAKTLIWDKETDVRQVFQYAEFGSPTDGNPKDYDKLNMQYFHLINKAKTTPGVNVGFIQSMRNEWVMKDAGVNLATGKKKTSMNQTGRRIKAGYDRLDELVFAELHFERREGEFFIQVGKCRQQPTMQDQEFAGMPFSDFGQLLMPGTSEEDWQ